MLAVIDQDFQAHGCKLREGLSARQHLLCMRVRQHGQFHLVGLEQTGGSRHFVRSAHHGSTQWQLVAQHGNPRLTGIVTRHVFKRGHDLHIAFAKNIPETVGRMRPEAGSGSCHQRTQQAESRQEKSSVHKRIELPKKRARLTRSFEHAGKWVIYCRKFPSGRWWSRHSWVHPPRC
jgi:hypothetical protein